MPDQQQAQFTARLLAKANDNAYEIVCMSAGTGNGWEITPEVLQASLQLWDGANSFVDHSRQGHSIRDLCGVITSPRWDDKEQGIVATFSPLGPAKAIVLACADDAMTNPLASAIGFSADILFSAEGRRIKQFAKVSSVDLVINPARGGKFLRALNSIQENNMSDNPQDDINQSADNLERLRLQSDLVRKNLQARKDAEELAATQKAADKLRVQMCQALLSTTLAASKLPANWQERIRADFADSIFEPETLEKRITDDRNLLSATTSRASVHGPNVTAMFNEDDMINAAAQDLFGVTRDEHLKNARPRALTGIRELYHMLTGDFDLHGGFFPERAMFQLTTSTFPIIVKNAMNKALIQHWQEFGRAGYNWWENITTIEHFTNLNEITWMLFGTIASLPTVAEGGEYTPLMIGDAGETTTFSKKGGYVGLTLEAIDRDDTRVFRSLPRELAFAGIREISAAIAAIFTSNSAVGPTLADTGALFNSTAVTTKGGHANLLTTAIGTDYTAWEAAASAIYNQPLPVASATDYWGTGKKIAMDPKYILVPRALRGAANNLFLSRATPGASQAITAGKEWYGEVIPLTVPEWTDVTDWAAVVDPKLAPGIMLGERFGVTPEIFIAGNETDPAVFMNDESRIKVRHFTAVGVADFRPLHKSNVGG